MEDEPIGFVNIGEHQMGLTRRSARLVKYIGNLVAYNHIRIEDDEKIAFMFRALMKNKDQFDLLSTHMEAHHFPRVEDECVISNEVQMMFDRTFSAMAQVEDFPPEDWQ